jgi:hypothetical protein
LRVLARLNDLNQVILVERNIDEFLQTNADQLAHALERLSPTFSTRGLRQRFWWGEGVRKRDASKGRVGNSPVV